MAPAQLTLVKRVAAVSALPRRMVMRAIRGLRGAAPNRNI
jgi:hypothetical protein